MRRRDRLAQIVAILFLITLSSCAFPTFTNYDSLTLSDQQVAILKNRWGWSTCAFCVRTFSTEGFKTLVYAARRDGEMTEFRLVPGKYEITYEHKSHKIPKVSRTDTVELKAGHVYRVKENSCYDPDVLLAAIFGGACRGRRSYTATVWIEDDTTGEVVAGEKWE